MQRPTRQLGVTISYRKIRRLFECAKAKLGQAGALHSVARKKFTKNGRSLFFLLFDRLLPKTFNQSILYRLNSVNAADAVNGHLFDLNFSR